MAQNPRYFSGSLLGAAIVHIVVVVLLVIGYQTAPKSLVQSTSPIKSIKAVAITTRDFKPVEPKVEPEVPDPQAEELERARKEREAEKKSLQQELQKAEEKLKQDRKKKAVERKRLAEEKKRKAEDARRQAEVKEKQESERKEQQRLAKLEEAEKLKKEQERKEAERKEADRKKAEQRKADQEKKRKQRLQREQEEEEQRLAAIMAEEEAELLQAAQKANNRELQSQREQYMSAIRDKIQRVWNKPAGAQAGQSCVVKVKQAPGGLVQSVDIVSCNGDAAFENSVKSAVYKADPLPSPPTPEVFERELRINFKPEDFG